MVGTSRAWQSVMHRVDQVASTNATVLLLGETGTGKELLARAIHERSTRRGAESGGRRLRRPPGVADRERALRPRTGAFTGAHASQAGRFEVANGGTVFLDEIGELPLELQPKLLRVHPGRPGRATRRPADDAASTSASSRRRIGPLAEEVRQKRFRPDLFYRLNVFPITVPPLRDRREDLPRWSAISPIELSRELGRPIERMTPGSLRSAGAV